MIGALQHLKKNGAFEAQVKKGAAEVYPKMSALTRERFDREMDWITVQQLKDGFMEMWAITEEAREIGATVGTAHRGLENSLVAYCLGLTDKDPLPENGESLPPYPFTDPMLPLNVGISISAEHRNRLVAMAEPVFGKSMMRAGLPILTLNGIVLEFFR